SARCQAQRRAAAWWARSARLTCSSSVMHPGSTNSHAAFVDTRYPTIAHRPIEGEGAGVRVFVVVPNDRPAFTRPVPPAEFSVKVGDARSPGETKARTGVEHVRAARRHAAEPARVDRPPARRGRLIGRFPPIRPSARRRLDVETQRVHRTPRSA